MVAGQTMKALLTSKVAATQVPQAIWRPGVNSPRRHTPPSDQLDRLYFSIAFRAFTCDRDMLLISD